MHIASLEPNNFSSTLPEQEMYRLLFAELVAQSDYSTFISALSIIGNIVFIGGDEGKYINQLLDLGLLDALATVIEQNAPEAPEVANIALLALNNIVNESRIHLERVFYNDRLFPIVIEQLNYSNDARIHLYAITVINSFILNENTTDALILKSSRQHPDILTGLLKRGLKSLN